MKKNFTAFLLALVAVAPCTSLTAAENLSYTQLSLAAGAGLPVPPPAAAAPSAVQDPMTPMYALPAAPPSRWPTSVHGYFDTAQVLGIRTDDAANDYYPFAGKVEVQNNSGDSNNQSETLGLQGGMVSESGHPGLFSNGGDVKRVWEDALKDYRDQDFVRAYYKIGLVAHLTQDQAVPAHAANINHVITFGDNFEKAINKNKSLFGKVRDQVRGMALPDMEPWQYYQALQDDTRGQLAGWIDPATKTMYWPPASDAPPLGQDATRGSWSHYSNKKDTYDFNVSPRIMERQVLMASVYTAGVLKAAARLLPPVAGSLSALRTEDKNGAPVDFKLNIYDNRLGDVKIKIERPLYGLVWQKEASLYSSAQSIPSVTFSMQLPALANAVKGKDIIVVTLTDKDGNVSRSEVKVRYEAPYEPGNYGG